MTFTTWAQRRRHAPSSHSSSCGAFPGSCATTGRTLSRWSTRSRIRSLRLPLGLDLALVAHVALRLRHACLVEVPGNLIEDRQHLFDHRERALAAGLPGFRFVTVHAVNAERGGVHAHRERSFRLGDELRRVLILKGLPLRSRQSRWSRLPAMTGPTADTAEILQ